MESDTIWEKSAKRVATLLIVMGWVLLSYAAWSTTSLTYSEAIAKAFVRGVFLCFFGAGGFAILEGKHETLWAKACIVLVFWIIIVAIGVGSGFLARGLWELFHWAFLT